MNFYGLSYTEAIDLPLRTFWMLSKNVTRIAAEQDIRLMSAFAAAQSADGFKKAQDVLKNEMGEVFSERVDVQAGLNKLKALAGIVRSEK